MAKYGQDLDGILLLDKSIGMSSNSILQKAKRYVQANKAGHTGSLDPLASGMLPICFGEATKFSRFLLEADKCYQTTMRLGVVTTTGDSEGEIIATNPVIDISAEKIATMITVFQGVQQQIPPMYSALKYQGQPLYKLARQQKVVPRLPREIHIRRLHCNGMHEDATGISLSLTVECSKGTYIRTLCEDMGNYLGCGAHVTALRRLWVAPFQSFSMVGFPDSETSMDEARALLVQEILSVKTVLSLVLPSLAVSSEEASSLQCGRAIVRPSNLPLGWITLLDPQGELLGVGEVLADCQVAPRRLMQQRVQEVVGLW